jgi:predicted dehydrogenase
MGKVINVALASYGMSGAVFHAPSLLVNPDFAIRKILERHKQKSKRRFPHAEIVRQYRDILDDPAIDLVVVNTPNAFHFEMARDALRHGKHVVLEKPLTTSVAEGEELLALARDEGLVLAPYQNRRLESGHKTVREILDRGLLGNVKLFETRIDRWRPGAGTKKWKEEPGPGAGLLYDLGAHLIDEALVLFGRPDTLYADLRVQRANGTVNDYFHLILNFGDLKAELKAGLIAREPAPWYVVHGDRGSYVKQHRDPQEQMLIDGILPGSGEWRDEDESQWGFVHDDSGRRRYPSRPGAYHHFYENLYDVLSGRAELLVQPREALEVVRLIELAQTSHAGQRAVPV